MENKAISVTLLNNYISRIIDSEVLLKNILVEGEISNFVVNKSGHIYFTLKDEGSQIPCIMYKSYVTENDTKLKEGDKVFVKGSVDVYEKGGRYQLTVTKITESGIGDLYKKYEELKQKLEKKGYFDESHKKSFPKFPKNIALLTSETGAVIEDLKSIILRRSQFSNLILYPTKVQGTEAKYDIVRNIERANNNEIVDCIILARGGGSIEDLWPFNEEIVADAIYNSKKPLMSAVGHETDFTISDFVADFRAATPSDAALNIVRDNKDLIVDLDHLTIRLKESINKNINKKKQYILDVSKRIETLNPVNVLNKEKEKLKALTQSLNSNYKLYVNNLKSNHSILNQKVILLNPLTIIDKGYSVTYKDNEIIKDVNQVDEGDSIVTKVKNGEIESKVVRRIQNG